MQPGYRAETGPIWTKCDLLTQNNYEPLGLVKTFGWCTKDMTWISMFADRYTVAIFKIKWK